MTCSDAADHNRCKASDPILLSPHVQVLRTFLPHTALALCSDAKRSVA